MAGIPPYLWDRRIEKAKHKVNQATRFMSPEHRLVHLFVVREIPRIGMPLPARMLAQDLNIPLERVTAILEDLEKHLTFLCRNDQGQVINFRISQNCSTRLHNICQDVRAGRRGQGVDL